MKVPDYGNKEVCMLGQRRLGFLTQWQEEYIMGYKQISEDRQRTEDHYILKSWEKAVEQFNLLEVWLMKKSLIKTSESKALRKVFFSLRGKKPQKYYSFSRELTCPQCGEHFVQHFAVGKDRVFIMKGVTFGVKT